MRCQDEGLFFFLSSSSTGVWNQHGQNREDREEKRENLKIMSKETQNWHVKRKKKKRTGYPSTVKIPPRIQHAHCGDTRRINE